MAGGQELSAKLFRQENHGAKWCQGVGKRGGYQFSVDSFNSNVRGHKFLTPTLKEKQWRSQALSVETHQLRVLSLSLSRYIQNIRVAKTIGKNQHRNDDKVNVYIILVSIDNEQIPVWLG